jgi:alkylated DNA repair protein (DNA oxidative demethylase)
MVKGFTYHPDFLAATEADQLQRNIAALPFRTETFRGMTLKRTMVCYGSHYITAKRSARNPAPPIPDFLISVRDRAARIAGLDSITMMQAIIWRFPPTAAIDWHVGNSAFGPVVCGVSLGSPAVMHSGKSGTEVKQHVEVGSLYILRDEARYEWKHKVDGIRGERYSITFWSMVPDTLVQIAGSRF